MRRTDASRIASAEDTSCTGVGRPGRFTAVGNHSVIGSEMLSHEANSIGPLFRSAETYIAQSPGVKGVRSRLTRFRESVGDTAVQMPIGAALAWDDDRCKMIIISAERARVCGTTRGRRRAGPVAYGECGPGRGQRAVRAARRDRSVGCGGRPGQAAGPQFGLPGSFSWGSRRRSCGWKVQVLAGSRSGDGPLSVRARPSSIKRHCDRGTTSAGEKWLVNVHAKSRLTRGVSTGTHPRQWG